MTFMRTNIGLLLLTIGLIAVPIAGLADSGSYQITGGFTTFSGNVGGDSDPNYIKALPDTPISIDCSQVNCSNPLLFFGQVCPDAGCQTPGGTATNYSLVDFAEPTNFLTLESFGCPPGPPACANTKNELDFTPSNLSILGYNQQTGQSEMLLGTITFANGTWTGDADFGITITATDI